MKKLVTGLAVLLASLGLTSLNTTTAQAASQTLKPAKLTKSYKGSWYVYDGQLSTKPKLYSFEKVRLTNHNMKVTEYMSAYKSLKQRTKQYTVNQPARFTKRTGGGYKVAATGQTQSFGTLKRVSLKVKGKSTVALKLVLSGRTMYAFRKAVTSRPVGFYQLS